MVNVTERGRDQETDNSENKIEIFGEKLGIPEDPKDPKNAILRALSPKLLEDPEFKTVWFGHKKVESFEDLKMILFAISEAAAKFAEAEWVLTNEGGCPQTSGANAISTQKKRPEAGFHLTFLENDTNTEGQEYQAWKGVTYPLSMSGLDKALKDADSKAQKESVQRVIVTPSWVEYLKGNREDDHGNQKYLDSLFEVNKAE